MIFVTDGIKHQISPFAQVIYNFQRYVHLLFDQYSGSHCVKS